VSDQIPTPTAARADEAEARSRTRFGELLPESLAHFRRASRVIPGGTARSRFFWPVPTYIERGEGGYLFDVDDRRYVDCNLAFGPLLLGHCHPEVSRAIEAQVARGVLFGAPVVQEAEFAECLLSAVPGAEQVIFLNSGTEATMAAVRIARAATGRERVAKFEGGWHGWHDGLFYSIHPAESPVTSPVTEPGSRGMPTALRDTVLTLPYNDAAAIEILRREGRDVGCVVIEAVQGAAGCLVADAQFLRDLREVCSELGILFILDEVISGFRLGISGAAGYFGITPDITVLGKTIGGGLPIAAICGPADLFGTLIPDANGQAVLVAGTTSGNPLSIAAAQAQLAFLMREQDTIYEQLWALGEQMRSRLRSVLSDLEVAGAVTGIGPWWGLHLGSSQPPRSVRDKCEEGLLPALVLAGYLGYEGVHMMAPVHQAFLCTEHTERDVEVVAQAHASALTAMRSDGLV
jgi:glutamate-1-semialdehyde 2,1-aminomutase